MVFVAWVIMGLAAGLLADRAAARYGRLEDCIVGAVGAVASGWLFTLLTGDPVTEPSLPGVLFALGGAAVFLAMARSLTQDRTAI